MRRNEEMEFAFSFNRRSNNYAKIIPLKKKKENKELSEKNFILSW